MIITTKEELISSIKELKKEDSIKKRQDKYTVNMRKWLIENHWTAAEKEPSYAAVYYHNNFIRDGRLIMRLTKNNGQHFYATRNVAQNVIDELMTFDECDNINISDEVTIVFKPKVIDIALFVEYSYLEKFIPILKQEVIKNCIKLDRFEIRDFTICRKYFDCVILDNNTYYWGKMNSINTIKNFMGKGIELNFNYTQMFFIIEDIFCFEGRFGDADKAYQCFKRKITVANLVNNKQELLQIESILEDNRNLELAS